MSSSKDDDRIESEKERKPDDDEIRPEIESVGNVRPSISVHFIRHAESGNNEVYRNARYIFRGGTKDFDEKGWQEYVDKHRKADPGLSTRGCKQADALADYLVPHLQNQASKPVRVVISPMNRTLRTIQPTLKRLQEQSTTKDAKVHMTVNAFYHESDGCHIKNEPVDGMSPAEISEMMSDCVSDAKRDIDFAGFPDPNRGWFCKGKGEESRAESEDRAAKFYLWLCEYLDQQLHEQQEDVFDAGVSIQGEEKECEHDKHGPRIRRRRTALVVGHADFMGLVIKRVVTGYGHFVETKGHPHRSAFVHFNTGFTDLEYFGNGRFLIMCSNHTPHISPNQYSELRSGGSLKDGWSYIVPTDKVILNTEVTMGFSDELEEHVQEQTKALKALYLKSSELEVPGSRGDKNKLEVEDDESGSKEEYHFTVKRGLQVVGVATYKQSTGHVTDVAIRPSAACQDTTTKLMMAVKSHAKRMGRSGSLVVHPRSTDSKPFFEAMGFSEMEERDEEGRLQMVASLDDV